MMLAVTAALSAVAGNRSQRQMRDIAERQLAGTMTRGGALSIKTIYQNEALAVIGDTAVGFAVVSRSEEQPEVLGVSRAAFSQDEAPEAYQWWLRSMTRRLQSGIPMRTRSITAVPNFVETHWDQNDPFNGLCPKDGTQRCPTGCVATAMAQVMKYYNYPAKGRGQGFYSVGDEEDYHVVSINSTYDWQNMHTAYKTGSGSVGTSSKRAVQQLMYDAGCAVGMNYCADGSLATDYNAALAMFQNFSYDSLAIRYLYRNLYTDQEWEDILYGELAQKRPIIYGGQDSENLSGHAFLLTGNDEEGKVYVNWGWGRGTQVGGFDGYFEISGLILEDVYHFDSDHDMVVGFRPQLTPDKSDGYTSLWVFDDPVKLTVLKDKRLLFGITAFFNLHVLNFQGILWYTFRNTANNQTVTAPLLDLSYETVQPRFGYQADRESGNEYITDTLNLASLNPGTYEFTLASQARGEMGMSPMRTTGGPQYITIIKGADGSVTIEGQETAISTPRRREILSDGQLYDLNGRRAPSSTGITIRDGRKFIRR